MADAAFRVLTEHVDMFTPDDRTDRPALGAVHGVRGTLLVEGGASAAHLRAFLDELEHRGRPPAIALALTHWHWDHSFGASAAGVPVIAHPDSAAELRRQAAYDWSDEALDARVAEGLELAFCRDMLKLELPDRSGLRIAIPDVLVADRHAVDLGGVSAEIRYVGGDHAPDSLVVYVPSDRVLFLGDCLYQRLHSPVEHLTVAGVRGLMDRLAGLDVAVAVEGHNDEPWDAAGFDARLRELRTAADMVERYGTSAAEHTGGGADLDGLVGLLLAGEEAPAAGRRPGPAVSTWCPCPSTRRRSTLWPLRRMVVQSTTTAGAARSAAATIAASLPPAARAITGMPRSSSTARRTDSGRVWRSSGHGTSRHGVP